MMPTLSAHPSPPRSTDLLKEQMAESAKLDKAIGRVLREVGDGW